MGSGDDVPSLSAEEAGRMDQLFDLGEVGSGEGVQGREALKEGWGDLIDPFIGTLGGQPDREEQFVILLVGQGADTVWVEGFERVDDGAHVGRRFHKDSPHSQGYHKRAEKATLILKSRQLCWSGKGDIMKESQQERRRHRKW